MFICLGRISLVESSVTAQYPANHIPFPQHTTAANEFHATHIYQFSANKDTHHNVKQDINQSQHIFLRNANK